jgi:hypothetical protein
MQEQPSSTDTEPKKKSKRGCLIAVIVVAAVILLIIIALVAGGIFFMKSETGQKIVGLAGAMMEGSKAPGTAELKAMGCEQALVVDAEKFNDLLQLADRELPLAEEFKGKLVICQAPSAGTAINCEDVARTYRGTFGETAPHPFAAAVTKDLKSMDCIQFYSSDGTPKKD